MQMTKPHMGARWVPHMGATFRIDSLFVGATFICTQLLASPPIGDKSTNVNVAP